MTPEEYLESLTDTPAIDWGNLDDSETDVEGLPPSSLGETFVCGACGELPIDSYAAHKASHQS